jgi:hypothetical protein
MTEGRSSAQVNAIKTDILISVKSDHTLVGFPYSFLKHGFKKTYGNCAVRLQF